MITKSQQSQEKKLQNKFFFLTYVNLNFKLLMKMIFIMKSIIIIN